MQRGGGLARSSKLYQTVSLVRLLYKDNMGYPSPTHRKEIYNEFLF